MQIKKQNFNVEIQGAGIPFIWTHGLTMSMELDNQWLIYPWQEISKHCRLIRYDARGHGKSHATREAKDYEWPHLADDLLELADALGIEEFIAGGASMGCATSLYTATFAPERILGLVLSVPSTAWEERAQTANQYFIAAKLVAEKGIAALIAARQKIPIPELFRKEPVLLTQTDVALTKYDPKVLSAVLQGAGTSNFPEENSLRFKFPTLILAWENFLYHPLTTAEKLHQLIPYSELLIAKDLTMARIQAAKIIDFIKRLDC